MLNRTEVHTVKILAFRGCLYTQTARSLKETYRLVSVMMPSLLTASVLDIPC